MCPVTQDEVRHKKVNVGLIKKIASNALGMMNARNINGSRSLIQESGTITCKSSKLTSGGHHVQSFAHDFIASDPATGMTQPAVSTTDGA